MDAGFEDRVMFGTDQFMWPKLMAYSIGIIQNADYRVAKTGVAVVPANDSKLYKYTIKIPGVGTLDPQGGVKA